MRKISNMIVRQVAGLFFNTLKEDIAKGKKMAGQKNISPARPRG